jgi:hypothetical protein
MNSMKASHIHSNLVHGTYTVTIVYFLLGFLSIYTGLLALGCMAIPFLLILRHHEKRWCHRYCPRASLITITGKRNQKKWKILPPNWHTGTVRKLFLWYFSLNLLFIAGSTTQIALGRMEAMPYIRLFIAIPLWPLPQVFSPAGPEWLTHLSYRFYSMMLSTTILGITFSRIWRPRAWCAICPIGTLSNKMTQRYRS